MREGDIHFERELDDEKSRRISFRRFDRAFAMESWWA